MQRSIVCSAIAVLLSTGSAIAKKKGGQLPRLDPKREEREFQRKLALAESLREGSRCGAAYPMYLELQKEQPNHRDVLMGIGVCGTEIAKYPELGLDERRQRLLDASAAFAACAALPAATPAANVLVAFAQRRATELAAEAAALAAPAASSPSPTPPPVAASVPASAAATTGELSLGHAQELAQQRNLSGALAELEVLLQRFPGHLDLQEHWVLWRAASEQCDGVATVYERIAEQSWRPEVHMAGAECADRSHDVRAHLEATERYVRTVRLIGDPEIFYGLAEGFATLNERQRAGPYFQRFLDVAPRAHPKRYIAEMYLRQSDERQVRCLINQRIARPQAVEVGGQWVSKLTLPLNYREITCGE